MAESNAQPKPKTVRLDGDLNGWQPEVIHAHATVGEGNASKQAYLKKEFQVLDAVESPAPAISKGWISISKQRLLDDRVTLEFIVTVDPKAPVQEIEQCGHFVLSVQAQLDPPGVKNAMGAAARSLIVEAKVKLIVPVPIARVTLHKYRWNELKDFDLFLHMERSELAQLFREGGELYIPTLIQPLQSARPDGQPAVTLEFDRDIRVFDIEGQLNWMGSLIEGEHDDQGDRERKYLIFKIPAPSNVSGADTGPGSPTLQRGSGDRGDG